MGKLSDQHAGNLPLEVSSFVGRSEATAEVRRLLGTSRLVTLTGVAGVGKTRLALHVARGCRRAFPGGAWQVELANLREPSSLEQLVAETLGLRETAEEDLRSALAEYLAPQTVLLLLDNCEHVVDACARLLDALLPAAPNVRVLVTSREPLRIRGERVWTVAPLAVPDSGWGDPHRQPDAVALFEQRTAAVRPRFTVDAANRAEVARVCQMLEGLPLAIELASVRMGALSIDELCYRLQNRFQLLGSDARRAQRHETLRDAVAWSFALCSPQEQTMWARLSVFIGGFDVDAAEGVCTDDELVAEKAFSALAGLIDKSVLTVRYTDEGIRYRMLETIREYGDEQLIARGEQAAVRRRHRDYYLRLAEQAAADWFGSDQYTWAERLRPDAANVRAALTYCFTEPDEAPIGLRMAGALWVHWVPCGLLSDGRSWLDKALAAVPDPSLERGHALWANAYVATRQGDLLSALAMLDECRSIARRLGDARLLAHADSAAGMTLVFADQLPEARDALHRSLAYYDTAGAGPDSQQALALFYLSHINVLSGDTPGAIALCRRATALCEVRRERWAQSSALWGLGLAHWQQGQLADAHDYFARSLRSKYDFGDTSGVLLAAAGMAWTAATAGHAERAARMLGATETLWSPLGTYLYGHRAFLEWHDGCETHVRRQLGDAVFRTCYREGADFTLDVLTAFALQEPHRLTRGHEANTDRPRLSDREREVAELIADGLSSKQIAARLVIARRTVESHVDHILTKLGFTTRTQIAAWLRQHG